MFKGVIFDFDGTLVDSDWAYVLTDIEFFKAIGGDYYNQNHHDNVGLGVVSIIKNYMLELNITDKSVDELVELNDNIFLNIAQDEIQVYPEMLSFIKELYNLNIPMAIATGSTQTIVEAVCHTTGLDIFIDKLYSSRFMKNEKPQPDIFLYAAKNLGLEPTECLVIEDSQAGVTAAIRAGMSVIWIDNFNNRNKTLQKQTFKYYSNGHKDFNTAQVLKYVTQCNKMKTM